MGVLDTDAESGDDASKFSGENFVFDKRATPADVDVTGTWTRVRSDGLEEALVAFAGQ